MGRQASPQVPAADKQAPLALTAYPVDLSASPSSISLAELRLLPHPHPTSSEPIKITRDALLHWNHYLASGDEQQRHAFLAQAGWLVQHTVRIGDDAAGWPHTAPVPPRSTRGSWLSAITQGWALSVLTRAFALTADPTFLELADQVVRTFERDILDGGVSAPLLTDGVLFEAVAVYPAAHQLSGFLFAILGLADYVALTGASRIQQLLERSLRTLHGLLEEFDTGWWTRVDLLGRGLASPAQLELHVHLLEGLARSTQCEQCTAVAARWRLYLQHWPARLHYQIISRCTAFGHAMLEYIRSKLFPKLQVSSFLRVCIHLPAFPITGGVLTVLNSIAQVTKDTWSIEYVTQCLGPDPDRHVIHRFGTARMTPWHFPLVWLYVLSGTQKLISLILQGADYDVLMPQDAVFTGAFAALVAKLAGVRVVCIDHSTLTWIESNLFHTEYRNILTTKNWPWILHRLVRLLQVLYWPSLSLLARISVHFTDHFLIPGVPGDEMEEICNRLKIPQSRVSRFASMIDIRQHILLDAPSRAKVREEKGIAVDAIVVAIVCRLSPEKGLDIALESIHQALSSLPDERRERVRVIIAGDGPLRKQLEEDVHSLGLSQICWLWGDTSAQDVLSLLAISDIFLYTSTRGACMPMSVLEAMASACAVIATTQPLANAVLLADGRGSAIPPGNTTQARKALEHLLNDSELCRRMGKLARDYIAEHHSPVQFRRTLLRATYWSGLDTLLDVARADTLGIENGDRP
jgi:glycosyltransferase involved in cell wall biosynthesis